MWQREWRTLCCPRNDRKAPAGAHRVHFFGLCSIRNADALDLRAMRSFLPAVSSMLLPPPLREPTSLMPLSAPQDREATREQLIFLIDASEPMLAPCDVRKKRLRRQKAGGEGGDPAGPAGMEQDGGAAQEEDVRPGPAGWRLSQRGCDECSAAPKLRVRCSQLLACLLPLKLRLKMRPPLAQEFHVHRLLTCVAATRRRWMMSSRARAGWRRRCTWRRR